MTTSDITAFVSGGASGLGEACVRRLIAGGGKAIVADLNEARGAAIAAELGDRVRFARVDVIDEASVRAGLAALPSINVAIHCAGVVHGEKIVGRAGPHTLDSFSRVVSVNLIGTFNVLRLAAEVMAKNEPGPDGERGVIITTASVAAFEGQIGQAAYAASKGGVASLTLPAARDLASLGIRVVCIAPGIFATPMMKGLPQPVQDSLAAQSPFPKRLGEPDEFAALALHIAENRMINGCVVRLDAAIRMGPR
jgi:NAD(P)-dependent dehydrogenase (short-subunit alcohol dehydrogenase family)